MTLPEGAYVTPQGWIVIGDEAYLPTEKLPVERRSYHRLTDEERATYHRDYMRRLRQKPSYRAKENEQHRTYYARMREKRLHPAGAVASLHDLRCSGPTRATGCRCSKIPMYRGTR